MTEENRLVKKRIFSGWLAKDLIVFFAAATIGILSTLFSLIQVPYPYNWPAFGFCSLLTLWVTGEIWERVEAFKKLNGEVDALHKALLNLPIKTLVAEGFTWAVENMGVVKAFNLRELSYDDQARCFQDIQPHMLHVVDSYPHWPPTLADHHRWRLFDEMLERGAVFFRVVRISSQEDWQAVQGMLKHWKKYNFYLGVLFEDPDNVPIVRCIILDRRVVYFGQSFLGDLQKGSIKIAHPESASLFDDYFKFLWGKALVIKNERGVDLKAIKRVELYLGSNEKSLGVSNSEKKDLDHP